MKQSSSIENGNAFAIAKFADEEIVYLKKKKKRKHNTIGTKSFWNVKNQINSGFPC